jgi:hypothetical protein
LSGQKLKLSLELPTIMSEFETLPTDPAKLAEYRAEMSALGSDSFDMTKQDDQVVIELEHAANTLGFTGQRYFIEARKSMLLPKSFEAGEPLEYVDFSGLTFEGEFITYSKVHIGRLVGGRAIRAVCLTFACVTLLPFFDKTSDDQLLYVPALAVESIQLAA